jgi:thioredoxin-like negative regulator of GroEL
MTESTINDFKVMIDKGMSYIEYFRSIENFVSNQTTSGQDITPERIEITKLNLHRMKRLNDAKFEKNSITLSSPIAAVIITEAWCGDSAQNIPWLEHFFNNCSPKITSYYVYRDDNPELMNQFLTNGSRSIPKCIFFNKENGQVLGTWGPRPEEIKNWLAKLRLENPEMPKHDWEIELHKYYTKNNGAAITSDLKEVIAHFA